MAEADLVFRGCMSESVSQGATEQPDADNDCDGSGSKSAEDRMPSRLSAGNVGGVQDGHDQRPRPEVQASGRRSLLDARDRGSIVANQ